MKMLVYDWTASTSFHLGYLQLRQEGKNIDCVWQISQMDKDTGSTPVQKEKIPINNGKAHSLGRGGVPWDAKIQNGEEMGYPVNLRWHKDLLKYFTFPKLIREREGENFFGSIVLGTSHILCNIS